MIPFIIRITSKLKLFPNAIYCLTTGVRYIAQQCDEKSHKKAHIGSQLMEMDYGSPVLVTATVKGIGYQFLQESAEV